MECVEQNPTTCEYVSQHLRMLTTDFVLRYKDVSKMSTSISLPGKNSDLEIIKKKKKEIIILPYIIYHLISSVFAHTCVWAPAQPHSSPGNSTHL